MKTKGLVFFCVLIFNSLCGQNEYKRLIDSANYHIDYDNQKTLKFLDSIPKPIDNYIEGRLAEYYSIKALIHDGFNEISDEHQCQIMALKYAEIEKNYKIAGGSCIELFHTMYFTNKDPEAMVFLSKAKEYYKKANYRNGVLEVKQMQAYIKFLDGEMELSNKLIHKHLDEYINIKDDAYYHLFARYMLTSNYLYLKDFKNAYSNFKMFKNLESNSTISSFNFNSFKATLNVCFADVYFEEKQIDSTLHHLEKASLIRTCMEEETIKEYYSLNAEVNNYLGDLNASKNYLDSLRIFEEKLLKNLVNSSFTINDALLKTENKLVNEVEGKRLYEVLGTVLIFSFLGISLIYFVFYKKQKEKLNSLDNQKQKLSYLKSTNEKLAVKVQGLEDFISGLKIEVKNISSLDDVILQRKRIKEFYTALHLRSSTLLDKSENHLELVNDFNVDFFKGIKDLYPELNDSEVIICYYLFIGFKNKEIAVFLNTTVRAIESKRYRITKKLNFDKKETTLLQFLENTFLHIN
ncbi:hypothetical protein N1F78_15090 [Seonamhaeicola sp. MEBiC1930]|uniref:helix-turn-helix transcriptional regulator n=1 Tax=Seonamhaeicola sp. MEBiC01930 TaxID=2976768 RepID=UPI003244FDED